MTEGAFVSKAVTVSRSRRGLARRLAHAMVASFVGPVALVTLAALLASAGLPSAAPVAMVYPWLWVLGWMVAVPLLALAALLAGLRRLQRVDSVEADRTGICLRGPRGERFVARDAIQGTLVVDGIVPEVEIALPGGDTLHVALSDAASARAMVAALGLGASDRWTAVPVGRPRGPLLAGCAGMLLGFCATLCALCAVAVVVPHAGPWILLLLGVVFVGATTALSLLLAPAARIVVGSDGIVVEKTLRRTLIPRASILDVSAAAGGLHVIVEQEGKVRVLRLGSDAEDRREALAAHIRAALCRAATSAGAVPPLLARGSRSVDAWLESLRRLAGGARGYRDEAIPSDALLRAAEDPDVPAEQRLGAAMVIGLGDDAGAKQRLRVAAEALADDALREAMERAAEGEAEAALIEGALAAAGRTTAR